MWLARIAPSLTAIALSAWLAACGGGGSGTGSVQVSISPTTASVAVGPGTQSFTASVSNTSNGAVSWQVGGVPGGNATLGQISASGMYSAPTSLPSSPQVTITAISAADPTKQASATVTLYAANAAVPGAPTGLAASNVTATSATISWAASSDVDGPGIAGYVLYRNGSPIASPTSTSYTDAALSPSTSYTYTVAAFDSSQPANVSPTSAPLVVTTVADTQAPSTPASLSATPASTTQINLSWIASTDNVAVTSYLIERCQGAGCSNFAQIATFPTPAYNDTGLVGATSYSYRVRATDAAGNLSGYSNVATASTANQGTIGSIQSAAQDPANGNSVNVALPSGQLAGDLNVVVVGWSDSTSSVTSVTDTAGNSYQVAAGPTTIAGIATQVIYIAQNIAAAANNVVTVAFSATVNSPDVRVVEYGGLSTVNALDTAIGASGNGTTLSSGTATTINATDVLVGANYIGGAFVAVGSGYTQRVVTTPDGNLVEDQVVSTAGSYSATSTQSPATWWVMQLVALRAATGNLTPSISPRNTALTLSQPQQFTTNVPGGAGLNWSVDGVAGGNATIGTVSASGLYTPPSTAGVHTVTAVNPSNTAFNVTANVAVTDLGAVWTQHNDPARTGQNLQEYALTPTSVSSGSFGKLWSCPVDGAVYAQPLYVAGLAISGGVHNVVFVVTMNDSVYAFDADSSNCVVYWQNSYSNGSSITPISSADSGCNDVINQFGITGTPVIDTGSQTIYLVTNTTESGNYYQRLHALNITNGAERAHSPVAIQASVPGTGDNGTSVNFNALYSIQRPGLALTGNGGVLIAWASHCDNVLWPWHGWVMNYDETALTQTAVWNATPNGTEGGVWMSGTAPAIDSFGNLFLSTGNGTFDNTSNSLPAMSPNNDFGESFVNLNPNSLVLQDFYAPSATTAWSAGDLDLSAGGVTVLPDGLGPSSNPYVMVSADKQGHLWLIDRTHMSGYVAGQDNTVQFLTLPGQSNCHNLNCTFSAPGYWNGNIYIGINHGPLLAFTLQNGLIPQAAGIATASSQSNEIYMGPDPTPSISASPSGSAIVWVLDNHANGTDNGAAALGPCVLRAYDATNLASTLYSSDAVVSDACGNAAKFTVPLVANGHVYIAGANSLTVYGLSP